MNGVHYQEVLWHDTLFYCVYKYHDFVNINHEEIIDEGEEIAKSKLT